MIGDPLDAGRRSWNAFFGAPQARPFSGVSAAGRFVLVLVTRTGDAF
jgi:hypothetical protein